MSYITVDDIPPADPFVVRELVNHLLQAYGEFLQGFEGEVTYIEGLMGVHNFHVQAVEHLVQETGSDVWRVAALGTFERRMKHPGDYDTRQGEEE